MSPGHRPWQEAQQVVERRRPEIGSRQGLLHLPENRLRGPGQVRASLRARASEQERALPAGDVHPEGQLPETTEAARR